MTSSVRTFTVLLVLLKISSVSAQGQYPMLDKLAGKVVERYQNSSCQ
ncbi:hypothetical protein R75461_05935 [Paraburkholderia nemoris]|nr:hypothetical protein [Paraburkholderia aspalathi]CAE6817325.1 hypothetical protein R75461_05935 [Paraburkholderia nemoris]